MKEKLLHQLYFNFKNIKTKIKEGKLLHNLTIQYTYYISISSKSCLPSSFHPPDILPGIPFSLHFNCMDPIYFSWTSYHKTSSTTPVNPDIPLSACPCTNFRSVPHSLSLSFPNLFH